MPEVFLKRIYDPEEGHDGCRILVDRLWPRGIRKVDAHLMYWYKDIAPSGELRKWFGHKSDRFEEFRQRYIAELMEDKQKLKIIEEIKKIAITQNVTLLYSTKNRELNNAVVLRDVILHENNS